MLVWSLVKAGLGTLTEIETNWCFSDLMKAKAVMELDSDMEYIRNHQRKEKRK